MLSEYITVSQAAEEINRTGATIRQAIRRGTLPAKRMGFQWVIRRSDLYHWRDNPPRPGPKPRR